MKRAVVLISGQGRNLAALLHHCRLGHTGAEIVAVISNQPDAPGLLRAEQAGVPTAVVNHRDFASRADFDAALMRAIDAFAPDLLLLAGFMRILTTDFVRHYEGRALNIHPSLLPRHPGLKTHAAALASGDAEHGASVHWVTAELDGGPVILQGRLTVAPQDTEVSLSGRVMREVETRIYPQALAWIARGDVKLENAVTCWHGDAMATPKQLSDLDEVFL